MIQTLDRMKNPETLRILKIRRQGLQKMNQYQGKTF
jgi:hypothetical protein